MNEDCQKEKPFDQRIVEVLLRQKKGFVSKKIPRDRLTTDTGDRCIEQTNSNTGDDEHEE